jgi:hypothetical protein
VSALFGPLGLILVACLPDGAVQEQRAEAEAKAKAEVRQAQERAEANMDWARQKAEAARRAKKRAYDKFKARLPQRD